jgi:hypothetical protein
LRLLYHNREALEGATEKKTSEEVLGEYSKRRDKSSLVNIEPIYNQLGFRVGVKNEVIPRFIHIFFIGALPIDAITDTKSLYLPWVFIHG